jgi:AcrR family transcriptional regulator
MEQSKDTKNGRQLSRDDWLRAALETMRSTGIDGVKVAPLAARLGVTTGSFYWHFKNRGELLELVLDYWERAMTDAAIDEAERFEGSPEDCILFLMQRVMDRDLAGYDLPIWQWAQSDDGARKVFQRALKKRLEFTSGLFREPGAHDDGLHDGRVQPGPSLDFDVETSDPGHARHSDGSQLAPAATTAPDVVTGCHGKSCAWRGAPDAGAICHSEGPLTFAGCDSSSAGIPLPTLRKELMTDAKSRSSGVIRSAVTWATEPDQGSGDPGRYTVTRSPGPRSTSNATWARSSNRASTGFRTLSAAMPASKQATRMIAAETMLARAIPATASIGMRSAIGWARRIETLMIMATKLRHGDANTMMAEGGIQAATKGEKDSPYYHYLDVMGGGHFTNVPELAETLVTQAPDAIRWLEHLGVNFTKFPDGRLKTIHGGGTSRKRMHFAADITGAEIMRTLRDEARNMADRIQVLEFSPAVELVLDASGRCAGAVLYNMETEEYFVVKAKAVVMATGGCGRLHIQGFMTTNHYGATADGIVMAYRIGCRLGARL